jgi:hypothetical protein
MLEAGARELRGDRERAEGGARAELPQRLLAVAAHADLRDRAQAPLLDAGEERGAARRTWRWQRSRQDRRVGGRADRILGRRRRGRRRGRLVGRRGRGDEGDHARGQGGRDVAQIDRARAGPVATDGEHGGAIGLAADRDRGRRGLAGQGGAELLDGERATVDGDVGLGLGHGGASAERDHRQPADPPHGPARAAIAPRRGPAG